MTALSVWKPVAPATTKTEETWTPECAPTMRVTEPPRRKPAASWILKVTETGESPRLKTPTLVRKPAPGPPLRIEVRTDRAWACESWSPGMNIPTVGSGDVE
jgi:hypothetical protein